MSARIVIIPSPSIIDTEYTTPFCPEGPGFRHSTVLADPDGWPALVQCDMFSPEPVLSAAAQLLVELALL